MDEAAAIIAATDYMTLATADADGVPWATPVGSRLTAIAPCSGCRILTRGTPATCTRGRT